jgi:hypothetical protein
MMALAETGIIGERVAAYLHGHRSAPEVSRTYIHILYAYANTYYCMECVWFSLYRGRGETAVTTGNKSHVDGISLSLLLLQVLGSLFVSALHSGRYWIGCVHRELNTQFSKTQGSVGRYGSMANFDVVCNNVGISK